MKQLIVLTLILLSFSIANAQTQTDWNVKIQEIKSLYQGYMDSALFMPIAIAIFLPIVIIGLFGIIANIKGILSLFTLGMFLGVLMFLLLPFFLIMFNVNLALMVIK